MARPDPVIHAAELLSQGARFLLEAAQARANVDAMEAQVRRTWYATARAAGGTERDCARIAPAFPYPASSLAVAAVKAWEKFKGSNQPGPSAWLNAGELPGAPNKIRLPAALPRRFSRKSRKRLGQALP